MKVDSIRAVLGVMYFGTLLLEIALSVAMLRRHLMVWKVFALRLMAAVVHLLAVDLACVGGSCSRGS